MAAGHGRRLARLVLLPGLPLLLGLYALAKPCLLRPAASRCRRSCPGVPNKPGHRGGAKARNGPGVRPDGPENPRGIPWTVRVSLVCERDGETLTQVAVVRKSLLL